MYPPAHICKRLYDLDPQVRLAWEGRPAKSGELNPGSFALVQLWRRDHYGAPSRPKTILELWNWKPKRFPDGSVDLAYVDRGPVFNKHGGLDPDWNGREFELVYRVNLLAFGIKNEEVMSGEFLTKLPAWFEPLEKRIAASRREAQRDMHNTAEAIGHEVGRELYRELNSHDLTLPIQTADDATKQFEQDKAKNARKQDPF